MKKRLLRIYNYSIVDLITYRWIPESPRWLLSINRKTEAMEILQKAASTNGMDPNQVEVALTDLSNIKSDPPTRASFGALFQTRELAQRSYLLFLNW